MTLTYDDVEEFEVHHFSMMASDIGLRAGDWPRQIETTIGNRMPLIATSKKIRDGDLLWITYCQANGCVSLRIYND